MEWFEQWFNSEYYHILYKNRNYDEAEFFLKKLTNLKYFTKSKKIIDVACGKGRHSIFLNKIGFNVTGIDLSKNSINQAKKYKKKKLKFDVADMRLTYRQQEYDIAINLFTSFGYFEKDEDDEKVLTAMYNNLKDDGILVIDFINIYKALSNLKVKEIKTINNIKFHITKNSDENFLYKKIAFHDQNKHYKFIEKIKIITSAKFKKLLSHAGFEIIEKFGNYSLKKFDIKESERLIIIAKKNTKPK